MLLIKKLLGQKRKGSTMAQNFIIQKKNNIVSIREYEFYVNEKLKRKELTICISFIIVLIVKRSLCFVG